MASGLSPLGPPRGSWAPALLWARAGGPRGGGCQLSIPLLPSQVFQRREDGSVNFFRGWQAYRDGFGKLTGEHWLGEMAEPAPGGRSPPVRPGPRGLSPAAAGLCGSQPLRSMLSV